MSQQVQEIPVEAKRVAFTCKTCIARSTFLAGFTYYEIGRHNFQDHHDPAYVVLMTAAFAFAVLSVGLGSFVTFYLERSKTAQQKIDFVDRVNDIFVRGCFRSFLLALTLYILGLGRCGFVYFDTTSLKYLPMAFTLIAVILVIYGVFEIARAQLLLQNNRGVSISSTLANPEEVVERAAAADPAVKRSGEPLDVFIMRQADTLAGRAVYITGFCQSGVTRFKDTDDSVGTGYLICITVAFVAAALPAFLLSVISIFISDTEERSKLALAALLKRMSEILFLSYTLAFLALSLALALMGWGCKYPHEAWIPLHAGLGAVACLISGLVYVWTKSQEIKSGMHVSDATANASVVEKAKETVSMILTQLNTTGTLATISSGFVFYNVVTFGTDIVPIKFGSSTMKDAFLEANSITLAAGFVASIFDSMVTAFSNDLQTYQQRARFLHSTRLMVRVSNYAFQLSMLGFIVGFGLFGLVKIKGMSYYELAFAITAGILMIAGSVLFPLLRKRAVSLAALQERRQQQTAYGGAAATDDDVVVDERALHKLENRPKRMDMMAYRALFFGGFAYFAINFFGAPERHVSTVYQVCMSVTFTLSITVVVWSSLFGVNNARCGSKVAQLIFNRLTRGLYLVSIVLSVVAMVSFLLAFSMIGYVKEIKGYSDYAPVMLIGAIYVGLLVSLVIWMVLRAYRIAKSPNLYVKEEPDFDYVRMMGQMEVTASQTTFIVGNVFYEILFSEANSSKFPNYVYFISAATTFSTGASVIAISTCIVFFMAQLRIEDHRRRFGQMIKGLKTMLFVFNDVCIFAWMTSLTVLGRVKYTALHGNLYEPSLVFGLVGVGLLALAFLRIKSISNYILRASVSTSWSMTSRLIAPEDATLDSTALEAAA